MEHQDARAALAQRFLDRAAASSWNDAEKTQAAIEYFIGAYVALDVFAAQSDSAAAKALADDVLSSVQMIQRVNGWREAERLARKPF